MSGISFGRRSFRIGVAAPVTLGKGVRVYSPPAGLGWPTVQNGRPVPQRFAKVAGVWKMLDVASPLDLVNAALATATPIYVDPTNGNNANSGLTQALAVKSFPQAFAVGNALGTPYRVLFASGICYYQQGFSNNSLSSTEPTQPVAIRPQGGRLDHRAGSSETFPATTNVTYTHTFVGGPTTAQRVFDLLTNTELTPAADAATVDATPDSWCVSSATGSAKTHIRRADGLQPTISNTLIVRNIIASSLDAFTGDLYIEGIDFKGSSLGALHIDGGSAAKNLVLKDVTANYGGVSANMLDGLRVLNFDGLVALFDVVSDRHNWKDCLNFHSNDPGTMYVLAMRCRGENPGKAGSTSNNGFTTHDDVVSAVVGGRFIGPPSTDGTCFHCIENTKTWALGAEIIGTATGFPGPTGNSAVKAGNSAKIWLENCVVTAADGYYALVAEAGATIYTRNCQVTGPTSGDIVPF